MIILGSLYHDEIYCRTNWENYYMEITMIIGIIVYFLNFFTGKTKNQKIANQVNRSTAISSDIEIELSIVSGSLPIGLFLSPSSASWEMMGTRYQNNRTLLWAKQ